MQDEPSDVLLYKTWKHGGDLVGKETNVCRKITNNPKTPIPPKGGYSSGAWPPAPSPRTHLPIPGAAINKEGDSPHVPLLKVIDALVTSCQPGYKHGSRSFLTHTPTGQSRTDVALASLQ